MNGCWAARGRMRLVIHPTPYADAGNESPLIFRNG